MGVLAAPSLCRHDILINRAVDQRFGWIWKTRDGLKPLAGCAAIVRFYDSHDTLIQEFPAEIYPDDALIMWTPKAGTLSDTKYSDINFMQFRVDVERAGGKVAIASGYARTVREG